MFHWRKLKCFLVTFFFLRHPFFYHVVRLFKWPRCCYQGNPGGPTDEGAATEGAAGAGWEGGCGEQPGSQQLQDRKSEYPRLPLQRVRVFTCLSLPTDTQLLPPLLFLLFLTLCFLPRFWNRVVKKKSEKQNGNHSQKMTWKRGLETPGGEWGGGGYS